MKNKKTSKILFWIISVMIFVVCAVVVHVAFSLPAKTEFLVAKWSAGEILTYVSTVTLALLAVWQNKKIQEESEKSQKRLEDISDRANELQTINKIIDIEFKKYIETKDIFYEFSELISPPKKLSECLVNISKSSKVSVLSEFSTKTKDCCHKLSRCIANQIDNVETDNESLLHTIIKLSNDSNKINAILIDNIINDEQLNTDSLKDLTDEFNSFCSEREKFLVFLENRLNDIIANQNSLEETRKIISKKYRRIK